MVNMPNHATTPHRPSAGMFLACGVIPLFAAGCYEHVVRADGFGSERVTLHESNLPQEDNASLVREEDRKQRRKALQELRKSAPKY